MSVCLPERCRASRLPALALSLLALGACSQEAAPPKAPAAAADEIVRLTDSQLKAIGTAPAAERDFAIEKEAIGTIDFDENASAAVFPPYAGRILQVFVDLGDTVKAGQPLYTIESPDFLQAEATLIAAAGSYGQAQSALARAKPLYAAHSMDQNDYEAAVAAEQAADGALRAARKALGIFGKSEAEADRLIASRAAEPALVVRSPLAGRVTARLAAPGLLVQPGTAPAPVAVADLGQLWMLANVAEEDSPAVAVGQSVRVTVTALPGHTFTGTVNAIGATIDPATRRVTLRSQIRDPEHLLRPGMFASFRIRTHAPVHGTAVPDNALVREGDGTMSVWVQDSDPHVFHRRTVRAGLRADGYGLIESGVKAGEPVATDGAILLSNILFGGAT